MNTTEYNRSQFDDMQAVYLVYITKIKGEEITCYFVESGKTRTFKNTNGIHFDGMDLFVGKRFKFMISDTVGMAFTNDKLAKWIHMIDHWWRS